MNDFAARHSSETAEHFTPPAIIELARAVLGGIDLDPASSDAANENVKAVGFYTAGMNGYERPWTGRVFLNPPGGWNDIHGQRVIKASKARGIESCVKTGACGLPIGHRHEHVDSSQKRWWQKLAVEWQRGHVDSAIFVCFSVELLQSTQVEPIGMLPLNFPICYPREHVKYLRADGRIGQSPPHSSCIIFLPTTHLGVDRFNQAFSPMGKVVVPTTYRTMAEHRATQNGLVDAPGRP